MAKDSKNESKTFSLKAHETNLLAFTQQHQQAIFSGILSTIVADRFGYQPTSNTKFTLNENLTEIVIEEIEPEKPSNPPTEDSAVKAA